MDNYINPAFYSKSDKYENYTPIPPELKKKLEAEMKAVLHAHRDCLRNCSHNKEDYSYNGYSKRVTYDVSDGYYGEVFGMARALSVLGYGFFGAVNVPYKFGDPDSNFYYWIRRLEDEVLEEENFKRDGRCEYCLKKYHKDDKSVQEGKWWIKDNRSVSEVIDELEE